VTESRRERRKGRTWLETKTESGPTSRKMPIFETLLTTPSTTSFLNGLKTMAWYSTLNWAWPVPGTMRPEPTSRMARTEMM
jgi:hypothetical protein